MRRIEPYLTAAHAAFEAAQDCAARLAALLMADALAKGARVLDRSGWAQARGALQAASDLPFPPQEALHFHHHFTRGTECLARACDQADDLRDGVIGADPLPALNAAWKELRHASHALPGFQTVDFSLSCCALHQSAAHQKGT